jgi:integrase
LAGPKVKGKRIKAFIKAFKAACAKAGLPGRIPHDLRRTAVRNLVRAGIPKRVALQHLERMRPRRGRAKAERRQFQTVLGTMGTVESHREFVRETEVREFL